MIRFAIVGTNWITRQFIDAAHESGRFRLSAVYSRSQQQADAFAADYACPLTFTSLEALAACPDINAVYIASPNALHCEQALLFMAHGKHVICEKPLASTLREAEATLIRIRDVQAREEDVAAALDELDSRESGHDLTDRLAAAGFGSVKKTKPADVLARLKASAGKADDAERGT